VSRKLQDGVGKKYERENGFWIRGRLRELRFYWTAESHESIRGGYRSEGLENGDAKGRGQILERKWK